MYYTSDFNDPGKSGKSFDPIFLTIKCLYVHDDGKLLSHFRTMAGRLVSLSIIPSFTCSSEQVDSFAYFCGKGKLMFMYLPEQSG